MMNSSYYKDLKYLGINEADIQFNLDAPELTEQSVKIGDGVITDQGALCIRTGKFTGRSPKDRYIVKDDITTSTVDWNEINKPIDNKYFQGLKSKLINHLEGKKLFVKDGHACADQTYRLNVRVVAEKPWSAQFVNNMFRREENPEQNGFIPDWHVICAPTFKANPEIDGTLSSNFAIINFTEKTIIIGGTGYTGEIKKGIFSVLNYLLPLHHDVLAMHCSANVGQSGDTAIFFGLSGTGKTTLSTDAHRALIGDDEHGWSENGVFNFEGGCYAKCIDLEENKEPEIFHAIRPGAILENIVFKEGTKTPDFEDDSITPNTRVSYPIYHIDNIKNDSKGGHPTNIFFLTCDAYGVLPPVSRLTKAQAMYHFISGYTAKVAGTEEGINEPQAAFSACFGAPFLPLHPTKYAEMLGQKMDDHKTNIWLINTGWTEGASPQGHRISLKHTRALINAALDGKLDDVEYENVDIFNLSVPKSCENVPSTLLNPINCWKDKQAYINKANHLAELFNKNFEKYESEANDDIINAAPKVTEMA